MNCLKGLKVINSLCPNSKVAVTNRKRAARAAKNIILVPIDKWELRMTSDHISDLTSGLNFRDGADDEEEAGVDDHPCFSAHTPACLKVLPSAGA